MPGSLYLWLAAAGLLLTGLAAIGTKVLHDFSRHELEAYCRRRQKTSRFADIMDYHDTVALGSESLQIVGCCLLVAAVGFWLVQSQSPVLQPWQLLATVAISTLMLLATTSWIPVAVVRLWSAPFLFHTWRFWRVTSFLLWPLTVGVHIVDAILRRLAGRPEEEEDEEEALEDEILTLVTDGQHDGLLERDAREMIEGVFTLGDADVSHIMTPRSRIDAVDIEAGWDEVLTFVINCRRTRVPAYESSLDNIIGILFVKDLLVELAKPAGSKRAPLRDLLRPATKIPSSKALDDMLQEFRHNRNHLAIVHGEYGEVVGVVTIEDILEEIVGEIADEHDPLEEATIRSIDEATVDAAGRAHLDELNRQLGIRLPETDDYNTIGGLVVDRLGYIPLAGEILYLDDVQITVTEANPRRVERVMLRVDSAPQRETARS